MIGHLRIKSAWSQLGLLLGLLGVGLIVTSLVLPAIVVSRGFPVGEMGNMDWSKPGIVPTLKLIQAVSSITIFFLPALLFAYIVFTGKQLYFMGFRAPVRPQMYGLAIVCIITAFPFVAWLGDLNEMVHLPKWMSQMEQNVGKQMTALLKANNSLDIIINVFIIAFLPALCEEFFFRGMMQRVIINLFKNPWAGIIVTAVLFSAAHLQFEGFLPRAFLGVVLGALYWYSGSLWTSILAHFVNNAVQVVLVSYAPVYIEKNPTMPLLVSLFSGALVVTILWIYRSFSGITYEKVYEPDELNRNNQFIA